MDEEAQKRNTDCVYFLASPLTCKKGNDCEYRHSESARINPRDCWYWLGGNCLNPNCSFRHPPLDGLSGGSASTSASAPAPAQVTSAVSLSASGSLNKPRGPCYYFNQGFCAKGDKCPFLHGPHHSGGNVTSQKGTKSATVTEPQPMGKKTLNGTEDMKDAKRSSPSSDPKTVPASNSKAVHLPPEAKPIAQARSQLLSGKGNQLNAEPVLRVLDAPQLGTTRVRAPDAPTNAVSPINRLRVRQTQPLDDRVHNGVEAEEWLGESSPGFDVLVDDGPEQLSYREDADYLSSHDMETGRVSSHAREINIHGKRELVRFDYDQPSVHDQPGYYDAEYQYDHGAYDPYKQRGNDHVGRQQPGAFSDRALERLSVRERRALSIEEEPEQNNIEDLRHRISKRRRVDGAKVVDNLLKRQHVDTRMGDFHGGRRQWDDEHRHQDTMHRDQLSQQGVRHNNRRLHGRITEAAGFKRDSFEDAEAGFERGSERVRSKSSPSRHHSSDHLRSRYREKERSRIPVDAAILPESRVTRGQNFKNNESRTDDINFAGPKTLAQIKQEKNREKSEEPISSVQSAVHGSWAASMQARGQRIQNPHGEERKPRLGKVVTHESNEEAGFEGPKPLSAILEAKRKADQENNGNTGKLHLEGVRQPNQGFNSNGNIESADISRKATVLSPVSEKEVEEGELLQCESEEVTGSRTVEDFEPSHGADASFEHKSPLQENGTELRENNPVEDTVMNEASNGQDDEDETCEVGDHEDEDFDHVELRESEEWGRDGEQMLEPDEDEEYLEDDDEDDFARKLGGIFS
eukprot:Gb_10712 [translate_table: standard]